MMDMSADEKAIMQKHLAYWTELLTENIAIVFGPVFDPKGARGAGLVSVYNEERQKQIIANDPANGLKHYEFYPMKVIFKQL